MKKFLAAMMVVVMALAVFTGCGNSASLDSYKTKIVENDVFDMGVAEDWEDSSMPDYGMYQLSLTTDSEDDGAFLMIAFGPAAGTTAKDAIKEIKESMGEDDTVKLKNESSGTFKIGKNTAERYKVTVSSDGEEAMTALYCFVADDVVYTFTVMGTKSSYMSAAEKMISTFTLK